MYHDERLAFEYATYTEAAWMLLFKARHSAGHYVPRSAASFIGSAQEAGDEESGGYGGGSFGHLRRNSRVANDGAAMEAAEAAVVVHENWVPIFGKFTPIHVGFCK